MPDLLYHPDCGQVLTKLLAAPVLHHTPALRVEWDAAAQRNLAGVVRGLVANRFGSSTRWGRT